MSAHPSTSCRLLAILALVAACAERKEARRADTAAAGPSSITVTATDFAFQAPDTITAGLNTFQLVNHGDQVHMAQLIRLDSAKTLAEFLVAHDEAFRTKGPRPAWAKRLGGPGAAEPHGSTNATHDLEPGNYAWICLMDVPDRIPHVVKAGMAKAFVVRPRSSKPAPQPAPEASIVMQLSEYTFSYDVPLTAGRQMIRVRNVGAEPHEVGLVKLIQGKTTHDFETWLQKPQGPPPANPVGGISSFVPGSEGYFEVDLTPGDYVLVCLVTAPDGRSHTEHRMIQHIRIG